MTALTVIVAGIGTQDLLDCLTSIRRSPPSELIVTLDLMGRSLASGTELLVGDRRISEEVRKIRRARLVRVDLSRRKSLGNGQYNEGIKRARGRAVLLTHEDMLFPAGYFDELSEHVPKLSETVVGLSTSFYQVPAGRIFTTEDLTLPVTPITTAYSLDYLRAVGPLDEEVGLWYDEFLGTRIVLDQKQVERVSVSAPPHHRMSRSLQASSQNYEVFMSHFQKWSTPRNNSKSWLKIYENRAESALGRSDIPPETRAVLEKLLTFHRDGAVSGADWSPPESARIWSLAPVGPRYLRFLDLPPSGLSFLPGWGIFTG